jgi:hypothetical protein
VKVATGPYSTLSNLSFLFSPSIGSVNPEGALPGEQILISGKNFTINLSNLLIYIGDVEIDSIFGGSSTQIIFPLPEGLPVGNTTIRVGTRLTATDSVLSPPFAFTVFDPRQPILTNLDPNQAIPGTQVEINGNGFVSGTTYVMFDNIEIGPDFLTVTNSRVTFNVPDYLPDGFVSEPVKVKVVVKTGDGDFESNELDFTVIEPSDIEFYYSAINIPGSSQSVDDSLYKATPIVNGADGASVKVRLAKTFLGMDIDELTKTMYYINGNGIQILNLTTGVTQNKGQGDLFTTSDIAYSSTNNRVYCPAGSDGLRSYDLNTDVQSPNLSNFNPIFNVKNDAAHVYWVGKKATVNENAVKRTIKASGITEPIFSAINPESNKIWVAVAVGTTKIYFVEGPTIPITFTNTSGTSTIYEGNKDGTGSPSPLYTFTNTVITDIEISKDGAKLYIMVSGENGAIESVPVAPDVSQRKVEVSNIRNGRYLDVFELD